MVVQVVNGGGWWGWGKNAKMKLSQVACQLQSGGKHRTKTRTFEKTGVTKLSRLSPAFPFHSHKHSHIHALSRPYLTQSYTIIPGTQSYTHTNIYYRKMYKVVARSGRLTRHLKRLVLHAGRADKKTDYGKFNGFFSSSTVTLVARMTVGYT